MLRLSAPALDAATAKRLAELQKIVDTPAVFAQQVALAKKNFSAQNKKGKPTFDAVKVALTQMCAGARRCNYCEDSCADEVEHLWPKNHFPGRVFVWDNYCYACGGCNGPKNNKFALFMTGSALPTAITGSAPPFVGQPVLIDPRLEDPTVFLVLDVAQTFHFASAAAAGTREQARGQYTIEVLGLNRDPLPTARRGAFRGYVARLGWYVMRQGAGAPQAELDAIAADVRATPHPTVWHEAVRFRAHLPTFDGLLSKAPQALQWKVGLPA